MRPVSSAGRLRTRSALLLALALAGCSGGVRLSPYRIDIRQGNYVTQDMVARLKPGMTRDQVRFVLGTPLVSDVFHADRWDYVYRFQPGWGEMQNRHIAVFFEDGKLLRVAGDVVAEQPGAAPEPDPAATKNRVIEIGGAADAGATPVEKK